MIGGKITNENSKISNLQIICQSFVLIRFNSH